MSVGAAENFNLRANRNETGESWTSMEDVERAVLVAAQTKRRTGHLATTRKQWRGTRTSEWDAELSDGQVGRSRACPGREPVSLGSRPGVVFGLKLR